jgi:hypothetical protein
MKVSELETFCAMTLKTFKGIDPLRVATWCNSLKSVIGTEGLELLGRVSCGGLPVSAV